ncbi:type VI secretion system Vgr family protein [Novilysobacter spongiicola]|uniref:Rhs element Vgr protein n=1 Tax=Lysobacter spongiicola DSM 21749 TaxID=1122188 RepID=A0A1T4QWC7_9GAMM|nr:type VI secretion system Vgr family protein [Lysobacter spongiicola]SKA07867.1 Rhs element Vgr protein [Lysobacter spongiicola DSM 21749]
MDSLNPVATAALAALARLRDSERLYSLQLPRMPAARLVVDRWQGWESLSAGYEWWVDALSTDACLPLDELVGQNATLWTRTSTGGRLRRSGLVREAVQLGSDGGLARYRLCLVPWTWLLTQGRHSRVFQERGVLEILGTVFGDYAPWAAWQVSDDVGPFLEGAPRRSYCVQYRESDFDFVSRLLAEEGLGWRIEEDPDAAAGHRMVLFAQSGASPEDPTAALGGGIRFHRSDATESSDTIQAFGSASVLGPTALTLLSDDYKSGRTRGTTLPLGNPAVDVSLEAYDPAGPYAFPNQAAAERQAGLLADARRAADERWFGRGCVRSFRAGEWFRLLQAPIDTDGHPEALLVSVRQTGVNNLPDAVRGALEHFPPDPPPMATAGADGISRMAWETTLTQAQTVGYANAFVALPRELPWRPVLVDDTGARLNPRPTAPGYQTAIVVGDGELSSDALGRIRVRFHFQNDEGAEGTADDSCWLRVAQRYAGPGVGSQFLPRVGQEVLVTFLEGDIDRPLVVGALYNGQGEGGIPATPGGAEAEIEPSAFTRASDHRPSAQGNRAGGNAPPWHGMSPDAEGHRNAAAMSGFKSKEFNGEGHNRLVFDDSDGQLRMQLATTHGASQLNLGHLIHQADNFRGSFRGEGFELRTDQWGAVRGERGLWISAYPADPGAPAGEHIPELALLRQAERLGATFSDIAGTHLTVQLAAHLGADRAGHSHLADDQPPLEAFAASAATTVDGTRYDAAIAQAPDGATRAGDGRVPHTRDAILGLSAPAGIALVAGQALHWSAGETLTVMSGADSNLAVAGDLRLHAGQAIGWLAGAVESASSATGHNLALVTAEGELALQAQNGDANLKARDGLKVVSANAEVELAAGKTVHLATAGGASITIEGGNMTVACPGEIRVQAGKKSFVGPAQLSREMNSWPESRFDDRYFVQLPDGSVAAGMSYEIIRADGAVIRGTTCEKGGLALQRSMARERVQIRIAEARGGAENG